MREIRPALVFLIFLILVGTLGYTWIERWPLVDSFYMTVITMSTVGFREIAPMSTAGKLFTSLLIVLGVGTLAYAATKTTEALLARGALNRRRRLTMQIKQMRDHVIVCGYGRMGRTVAEQLVARGSCVVVIDRDPVVCELLERSDVRHLLGDATDDAVLEEAGLAHASALAAVLPDDADNLFITVTARHLSPELNIVARVSHTKSEAKLRIAGATRALNLYRHGGRAMVRQLLQPAVTELIEGIEAVESGGFGEGGVEHLEGLGELVNSEVGLEEIQVQAGSQLIGVALRDSPLRKKMNLLVVGVRSPNGETRFNPPGDMAPVAGQTLIVLGRRQELRQLTLMAAKPTT